MTIKEKFLNGILWSSVSQVSIMIIEFVIGLMLARLLSPSEFGLIAMITVFISIAQIFINSGFSQALVRKQDCTEIDFSTVFVFNLVIGGFLFLTLFFLAPVVSDFYNKLELTNLLRVLALSLIISAFTIIQRTKIERALDFKALSFLSFTSSIISGVLAFVMAYYGCGVWSLVAKVLCREIVFSSLLWFLSKWKISFIFSKDSFKELFGFGSKLVVSGIIGTIMNNLYYIIIGKYFNSATLGYFNRAELFYKMPSENITGIVTSVAYPTMAKFQDDTVKFKEAFKKILTTSSFVVTLMMVGLIVVAKPMILTFIGEKWLPSVPFLQWLSLVGILYPLNTINVNILNVLGRSDLYMKLQFIMQLLIIPSALMGAWLGIEYLVYGMILNAIIGFLLFSKFAGNLTNYNTIEQLIDLIPGFLIAILMGVGVYIVSYFMNFSWCTLLIFQVFVGALFTVILCELFKNKNYLEIKAILKNLVE